MTYPSPYPPAYPPQYYVPQAAAVALRPGLVTAMGVTSIVVAGLSLLAGIISGLYTRHMYTIGQEAANRARSVTGSGGAGGAPVATPSVLTLPTPADLERAAAADNQRLERRRDSLVELFNGLQEMTTAQREQLAALLGRYAERMVPHSLFQGPALSPADVRTAVRRAGVLPRPSPNEPETAWFELPAGRMEIYADRAIFRPADGTGNLRVAAPKDGPSVEGLRFTLAFDQPAAEPVKGAPARGVIHRSGLNDQQVETVIRAVVQQCETGFSRSPTPTQLATFREELRKRLPPLVTTQYLHAPVNQVMVDPDGSIGVKFASGSLLVDSMGTVQFRVSGAVHEVVMNPVAGVLMIGEVVASAMLAVFLLVCGILVMKNSPRGAGLHWIYAMLKLPIAVLGGVTFVWVLGDLKSGMMRIGVPGSSSGTEGVIMFGVVMAVVAAVYPLILMIVLSTPTVRQFYASERARTN